MLKCTILKTGLILPFFRYISSSALIEVFLLLLFKIPLKRCCTGFKSSDILGQAIVFTVFFFPFFFFFSRDFNFGRGFWIIIYWNIGPFPGSSRTGASS